MDNSSKLLRLAQILPHKIPVSRATWWRWVKSGKAPQPVKIGIRVTAWRESDIEKFIATGAV